MNMEKKIKSTSAIVVTAASYDMPLHDIERTLVEMGIEQPVGVENARVPNITGWLKKATASGSTNPSRPLQSALEQLFLANMDVPNRFHWGWADQRNTQLLDFFLNFDDEICFLLFIESPQSLLARLSLKNPGYSAEAREQALRLWRESVEKLIAFNRAWPERTLLMNSLAWKFDSQNAIAYVADWLAINIIETAIAPLEPSFTDGANVLLTEVTRLSPEELYVYAPIWQEALALSPGLEVDQLADAVASFFAKFITVSIDLEKSKEVLDSKVLELTRELNQEKSLFRNDPKLEAELGEIKKENDLIIAQLHQVQEELEEFITGSIELEKSEEILDSKVRELTRELNQEKSQIRNDPKLESKLGEIKKENDLIIAQLHQVQEELEHNFLLLKESKEKQKTAHATTRKYKRQLRNLSSTGEAKWDYENVRLVRMINEPSYESIWIALENASFRDRQWPQFEFRLAAVNIQSDGFSEHSHYEFPKMSGDKQAFEKWFVESNDDLRGERFELRFHLGQSAIDVLAWNALNEKDQEQLVRLMLAIPSILDDLADEVAAPHRGWEPWLQLNAATLEVLKGLFLK